MFYQLNLISKKGPNAKMRKKYKIRISGAANRHAPVQYAKCVVVFFFFLSSRHDTNPLLHLSFIFVKKYNYILANINSESSRVIFPLFFSSPEPKAPGELIV